MFLEFLKILMNRIQNILILCLTKVFCIQKILLLLQTKKLIQTNRLTRLQLITVVGTMRPIHQINHTKISINFLVKLIFHVEAVANLDATLIVFLLMIVLEVSNKHN